MRRCLITLLIVCTLSSAFAADGFDGNWHVTYRRGSAPGRLRNTVSIVDGKGTWTSFASNGVAKQNACINRPLPLVVKSVNTAEVVLEFDSKGSLNGCFSGTLVLHPGDDGSWTGSLEGGDPMFWVRD